MKKKVGTVLEEALYRRVLLESARQARAISEILAEALERARVKQILGEGQDLP